MLGGPEGPLSASSARLLTPPATDPRGGCRPSGLQMTEAEDLIDAASGIRSPSPASALGIGVGLVLWLIHTRGSSKQGREGRHVGGVSEVKVFQFRGTEPAELVVLAGALVHDCSLPGI